MVTADADSVIAITVVGLDVSGWAVDGPGSLRRMDSILIVAGSPFVYLLTAAHAAFGGRDFGLYMRARFFCSVERSRSGGLWWKWRRYWHFYGYFVGLYFCAAAVRA
jgi:hypothetical protein